ncbi:hypothetical protein Tco_1166779 [Tanacetum coccineum]
MYWKIIRVDPREDNEIELWVELKRLLEPDVDDELWKSQKHDGIDIYMLVEKEYPLSRGVLTQMLAAKLLVEQNNEMSRELFRKIFMMAERPRRDEEVVVGEGVVVTSSSLEMLTNSCLGGIMVSLIFLEGLEEEALVEFMVELFEEDEDGKKNENDGLFNLKANDQSRKA